MPILSTSCLCPCISSHSLPSCPPSSKCLGLVSLPRTPLHFSPSSTDFFISLYLSIFLLSALTHHQSIFIEPVGFCFKNKHVLAPNNSKRSRRSSRTLDTERPNGGAEPSDMHSGAGSLSVTSLAQSLPQTAASESLIASPTASKYPVAMRKPERPFDEREEGTSSSLEAFATGAPPLVKSPSRKHSVEVRKCC